MEQIGNHTAAVEKECSFTHSELEEVRVVDISEHKGATQSLADAFATDHVARYFLDTPDMSAYSEDYKWQLHVEILSYVVAAHCYKGIVTTIGPNYDAVALWMPPGKNMDDWCTIFRSGMWRLYYKLSREGQARYFSEFLPLLHVTKQEILAERDDESYYLVYIGTKSSARGKGYARKLIEHGTRMADAEGRATYLESSSNVNVRYYEKFGFELKREIQLKRDSKPIELGIMVREPRNIATTGSSKRKGGVTTSEQAI